MIRHCKEPDLHHGEDDKVLPREDVLVREISGVDDDEDPARDGEQWLGLYVNGSLSQLISSTLSVEMVEDAINDTGIPGQKTGKSVAVDRQEEPVFLLRNARLLKPGTVATIFHDRSESPEQLREHQPLLLRLGNTEYELMVKNTDHQMAFDQLSEPPCLILRQGAIEQVVFKLARGYEYLGWHLIWAGDLDGDGKLDFYADLYPQENVSNHVLFLSSLAKPHQLVKAVAEFVTTGC